MLCCCVDEKHLAGRTELVTLMVSQTWAHSKNGRLIQLIHVDTQTFAGPLVFQPRPAEFVELQTDSAFPEGKGGSKEAGQNCALVSFVSLVSLLSLVSIHPASQPAIHPSIHLDTLQLQSASQAKEDGDTFAAEQKLIGSVLVVQLPKEHSWPFLLEEHHKIQNQPGLQS